jgi:hypothetical protein
MTRRIGVAIVLIRSMTVSALIIGATCFPAAAADNDASSEPPACSVLKGRDKKILERLPRESIEDVDRLIAAPLPPSPVGTEPVNDLEKPVFLGVIITVRPVEGLTVERLQRLVWCGLARASAADPARPTDWPRTPPGTRAEVYSGGDKFIVILRPGDAAAPETLWRAAQELKPSKTLRDPSIGQRGRVASGDSL